MGREGMRSGLLGMVFIERGWGRGRRAKHRRVSLGSLPPPFLPLFLFLFLSLVYAPEVLLYTTAL